ncbi:MAG TPA: amidohydrolase family protein [Candidatus Acidoferrales bacterium]|nr:amidohydrolase family protein [Candidatus Acidoferrales bacterium]
MIRRMGVLSVIGLCTLAAVMMCVGVAFAQEAKAPEKSAAKPKMTFVRCGTLIADATQPAITNGDVIVTDGKVTAVGAGLKAPAGAEEKDLSKYTCMPGLVDAHIHLWSGPRGQYPSLLLGTLRAAKGMEYALDSGVVAARVLGTNGFMDVSLQRAIDEGTIPGPHLIPAAHAISIPGGHGDFYDFPPDLTPENYYTPENGFINSPADAEAAVHWQLKYGAKVIKILASGGVLSPIDSPLAEQVSPEELKVIVEQAHAAHVKVAAHDENLPTIWAALRAGVDSIEHGAGLDADAANYMKEHGIYLTPTLYIANNIVENGAKLHMADYAIRKANLIWQGELGGFKNALKAGVKIAAGSDQNYEPGKGTVRDEVMTLVRFGATPQQALTWGTRGSADLLGLDDLGTLAAGKEGDIVATEGNPLEDIKALEKVRAVIFKGESMPAANRY